MLSLALEPLAWWKRTVHKGSFCFFYLISELNIQSDQTMPKILPEAKASLGKEHNLHLSIELDCTKLPI